MLAPGDWLYRDAHYLVCDMEVDERAARRWLPAPLRLARPATASIFIAWFPRTSFASVYREAGLFLHVVHLCTRAVFSPWMLVDDDVALILGRELLGYPKKLGEIDFHLEGARVSGGARRRGVEVLRMEGELGDLVHDPPPMLGRPHRNVRASLGLALPKVIAFTPHEEPICVHRASVRVTIGASERDPIVELGFGAVRASYLHRVNLRAPGMALPLPVAPVSPAWLARHLLLRTH